MYAKIQVPSGGSEQKTLLRSLMNIRMPGRIDEEFLQIEPDIYIWKGDITRLATSAGFVYDGERFDAYFSDMKRVYGFHDMYSGSFYDYTILY